MAAQGAAWPKDVLQGGGLRDVGVLVRLPRPSSSLSVGGGGHRRTWATMAGIRRSLCASSSSSSSLGTPGVGTMAAGCALRRESDPSAFVAQHFTTLDIGRDDSPPSWPFASQPKGWPTINMPTAEGISQCQFLPTQTHTHSRPPWKRTNLACPFGGPKSQIELARWVSR